MAQQDCKVLSFTVIADEGLQLRLAFRRGVDALPVAALRTAAARAKRALHLLVLARKLPEADHAAIHPVLIRVSQLFLGRRPMKDLSAVINLRTSLHVELIVNCFQLGVGVSGIPQAELPFGDSFHQSA